MALVVTTLATVPYKAGTVASPAGVTAPIVSGFCQRSPSQNV